MFINGIWSE